MHRFIGIEKACTILIHKKNDTNNPADFRAITLESVPLKVFTSCLFYIRPNI